MRKDKHNLRIISIYILLPLCSLISSELYSSKLAYVSKNFKNDIVQLYNNTKHYKWSPEFLDLFEHIKKGSSFAQYNSIAFVIQECLSLLDSTSHEYETFINHLQAYTNNTEMIDSLDDKESEKRCRTTRAQRS